MQSDTNRFNMRRSAHRTFNKLWLEGHISKGRAYKWLAVEMGIHPTEAHISMFEPWQCIHVIRISRRYLAELRGSR